MQIQTSISIRSLRASATALVVLAFAAPAGATEEGVSSSATAQGEARTNQQELVEEGLALYRAHDHRSAAERFLQAYAITKDPNLLFNVARCYEALGDKTAAIEKYEAFLADPTIDATGKERAERAVRVLRKKKDRGTSPLLQTDGVALKGEAVHSPAKTDNTKVVVGWIATSLLATGTAVAGVLAISSANQLRKAKDDFPGNAADIDRLSTRTLTLSVTADALGVATAVVGGLSLYWTLTSSPSQPELKAGISPTGLRLAGSF
jgi:tetratricopeptide (TPR) repeat protein